jgi:branched-chain amino acid transport system ATP-binding protein
VKTILDIKNLSISYGAIRAVKDISFSVNMGEIVSLIGANGAGKTTTLRAISGLMPAQGKIIFNGTDIISIPCHERVLLGLAQSPEGRGVFSTLTVLENLLMGAYSKNNSKEINLDLEQSFARFPRLRDRQNQLAGTLSGGEQQMLAICRALMSRPKLLLLDEPSLGLAPLIVAQIFELIMQLNKEGMTILVVEQNARMALKASHRAYVLETGLITLSGAGADLVNNPEVQKSYLGM